MSRNDLIIKMENREIRHITNVPESARATVDGREIGIHDVRVGMKLEKTITTTTTPRMVTKVETVTGKVFHVTPGDRRDPEGHGIRPDAASACGRCSNSGCGRGAETCACSRGGSCSRGGTGETA